MPSSPKPRGRRSRGVLFDEDGLQVRVDPDNPSGRFFVVHGLEASYIDLDDAAYLDFEYLRRIAETMDVLEPPPEPLDVVHLGGAGCALARSFAATRPRSRQVVFEIDRRVLDTARRFLRLRTSERLAVRVKDAREGVAGLPDASADLVVGDAFVGSAVPRPLATVEFAAEARRVLRSGGVYALNLIDHPPLDFARVQVATLAEVFDQVLLAAEAPVLRGRRFGNVVLFGTDRSMPVEELASLALRAPVPEKLLGRTEAMVFSGGAKPLRDADYRLAHRVATVCRRRTSRREPPVDEWQAQVAVASTRRPISQSLGRSCCLLSRALWGWNGPQARSRPRCGDTRMH